MCYGEYYYVIILISDDREDKLQQVQMILNYILFCTLYSFFRVLSLVNFLIMFINHNFLFVSCRSSLVVKASLYIGPGVVCCYFWFICLCGSSGSCGCVLGVVRSV